jgi:CubicO group peptidase (beta-lactamase class C family)
MNAMNTAAARMVAAPPSGSAATGAPAGVALGLRAGAVELTAVAGRRTAGADAAPMTVRTSHDLASVTKILATATALIRLVSDGSVGLDDPVARYVPAFAGGGKDAVTVRQLLLHRGGLWEWQPLYLGSRSAEEAFEYAATLELRYAPGSARRYSDLGFMLLGRVVAVAAGARLDHAVRQLVTQPLGLADTRFGAPVGPDVAASAFGDAAERRMVATGTPYPIVTRDTGFIGWRQEPVAGEVNDGNAFHAFGGVSGHAGLFAPLSDLLRFGAVLSAYREYETLWNPSVVETFLSPGPDDGQVLGFRSYQFTVDGETVTMYGHTGFVGCAVGFVPGADIAVALCGNRLLTSATPATTDELWTLARQAASTALRTSTRQR